jgi:hypothetical protein
VSDRPFFRRAKVTKVTPNAVFKLCPKFTKVTKSAIFARVPTRRHASVSVACQAARKSIAAGLRRIA